MMGAQLKKKKKKNNYFL